MFAGGPANPGGRLNPRVGQAADAGAMKRELPNGVYRVDASGRVTQVATEAQVPDPNGLAFSPDFTRLYVASTGKGPGDTGPGGQGDMFVFDVAKSTRPVRSGSSAVICWTVARATSVGWRGSPERR